jgi:hypothetical protein
VMAVSVNYLGEGAGAPTPEKPDSYVSVPLCLIPLRAKAEARRKVSADPRTAFEQIRERNYYGAIGFRDRRGRRDHSGRGRICHERDQRQQHQRDPDDHR